PLCKSINADEAVAYGAAVLAAKLGGQVNEVLQDLKLLDVTPLSLGIWGYNDDMSAIHQHDMSVMIPRNTPIPITMECNYGTHDDNQEAIDIRIYQGESRKVKDNTFIGSFILDGIPAAPAREETIKNKWKIGIETGNCTTGSPSLSHLDLQVRKTSIADAGCLLDKKIDSMQQT
ncbi:heat shock cognate 70 kDa protein-like protein, partial [Tanacetum coccineum]